MDLHGRAIALFHQKKLSSDEVLLVLDSPQVEKTLKHLDRYLKLMGTAVTPETLRAYLDFEKAYAPKAGEWVIPEKGAQLVLTHENLKATASEEDYTLFRLKNGIPLQGVDFGEEMLLNVAGEDYVSYTKGCYFGQEILARVHYRGRPPRQLAVKFCDALDSKNAQKMTSLCSDPESGKMMGFIFTDNL